MILLRSESMKNRTLADDEIHRGRIFMKSAIFSEEYLVVPLKGYK